MQEFPLLATSIKQTVQHLPSFRMHSSLVQHVFNLGTRIAATISSGSVRICPNRFSRPVRSASIIDPQNVEGMRKCWSLALSSVLVGTNQPICTIISPWRTSRAFATGLIVFAYSARNASLTGVNLLKQQIKKHKMSYLFHETPSIQ